MLCGDIKQSETNSEHLLIPGGRHRLGRKGAELYDNHVSLTGPQSLDAMILAAMGSPDPSGMQLNGLGGGISSTSKVCIISPSERKGYDVDYLFGQVEIKERRINWAGSCGNLSAAVGLFALAEGTER